MANGAQIQAQPLNELLRFRPRWWWDPVPEWFFDKIKATDVIVEVAQIQLGFEKRVLEAQIESIEQTMKAIGRMG